MFPKEGGNKESYQAMKPMNHNIGQHGVVTLSISLYIHAFVGTKSSGIGFKTCSQRKITPRTGNDSNYLELVKSQVWEEKLQPPPH